MLEAAEQVFGAKGYHGASVTEITRAAGVAQGTFYLYFQGKKEIFLDLVAELGQGLRAATLHGSPPGTPFVDAQEQGFRAFFEFAHQHRHIYRIIQECDRVDPVTYRRFYSGLAEAYAHQAGEAMNREEITAGDPEALAYALLGVGHFVALRYLFWDDRLDGEVQDTAVKFVQSGLRRASN